VSSELSGGSLDPAAEAMGWTLRFTLVFPISVGFSQAQPGIANVKKRLCRWVKSLAEGGVLEAQSVVKSDAHFVECLIDGIDKQMATNNEQFKKSLRNKVRYEVRNSFQGDKIACNIRGLMCLPQRTEVVLSKLQGNRRRTGYQTWCTAQPNFRHAEPCSTPPVRSEPAAACAASISAVHDDPTERCSKLPAERKTAGTKRKKKEKNVATLSDVVRLSGESVEELTKQFKECPDLRNALKGFESSLNALRFVHEYLKKLQHALPAPAGYGGAGNPGRGPSTLGPLFFCVGLLRCASCIISWRRFRCLDSWRPFRGGGG